MILNPENQSVGEAIAGFWERIKNYFGTEIAYAKITATEKLTILISALTVGAILIVVLAMALFYLSMALIFSINTYVGGYNWAMLIVGGLLLLIGFIVYLLRVKLIVNPIARSISKLFLDAPTSKTLKDNE